MAKGVISAVQDNGLNHIKNNCDLIAAVIAFTPGDAYATVMADANVVAQAPMTAADLVISDGASGARVLTSASKVDTDTNAGNPTHILFLDAEGTTVLAWTDESGSVVGTEGGALRIPSITLTAAQPA
jgi:hypothetical protein